jgi:hypothetical protein
LLLARLTAIDQRLAAIEARVEGGTGEGAKGL